MSEFRTTRRRPARARWPARSRRGRQTMPAQKQGREFRNALQHVRGDVHAHGNPQSRVVVRTPNAARARHGRKVFVVEPAAANRFGGKQTRVRIIHRGNPSPCLTPQTQARVYSALLSPTSFLAIIAPKNQRVFPAFFFTSAFSWNFTGEAF